MSLASSSYYYQPTTDLQAQEVFDLELRDHIERLHGDFPGYGYRRLGQTLRREGIVVNDKKIRRVQKKYQLFPIRWQSFKIATTDSNHGHKAYPNLLAENPPTGINQAWAADITYIPMRRGFVYLFAVLDWASRRVLAWRLSNTLTTDFCLDAVRDALARWGRPAIFNTDQGSQFTSGEFTGLLQANGIAISMDGKGCWRDNVFVERLWRSVKYEEVYLKAYDSVGEAKAHLEAYLRFYNTRRPHRALDGQSPDAVYFAGVSQERLAA